MGKILHSVVPTIAVRQNKVNNVGTALLPPLCTIYIGSLCSNGWIIRVSPHSLTESKTKQSLIVGLRV
jgi:hypothetical protein